MLQVFPIDINTDSLATPATTSGQTDLDMLKTLSFDELIQTLASQMVRFAINLTIAIVVFYVGKFIINKIHAVLSAIMIRRNVDKSLATFIQSLVRMVLYFLLVVTVIGILGIETSSFIALFASAGVAIGMALSGTLQNFAGGVLILLIKPYKVGDYIEAQGYAGTVKEIQIFHTIILTPDNKSIIIPNGGLSTGSVNNYSREEYRRVEWIVAISYGDNVDAARKGILDILASDDRVVRQYIEDDKLERLEEHADEASTEPKPNQSLIYKLFHRHRDKVKTKIEDWQANEHQKTQRLLTKVDRSPVVYVKELADSSVNLTVRAWTRNSDYWALFFNINERIYKELPEQGINFPFPQMDVHMKQA